MKEIVTKYLEGRATDAEQAELLVWLRQKENRLVFNSYKLDWKKGMNSGQLPEGSGNSWSIIHNQILQKSYSRWWNSGKTNLFFRFAAIFFFVISMASAVFFMMNQHKLVPEYYTSVIAEKGQISKVELPDGSLVWLNSGSEIKYSTRFAVDNRAISLSGEAYFQVTKNVELPLVVSSGDLQVKVLGTKFNVSAYPETDKINVVLESGRVELLNSHVESFLYELKPGERATYRTDNHELYVSNVNTTKFTAWKEGVLNIYDQSMEELIKRLEIRYNQKFVLEDGLKDFHYTFTIKNESLDEIIQLMEKITPVKAIQNNEIITFKLDKKKQRRVDG
jgi:ferric-dicitrate binding protein FerR (iron transport regulator)